jgi:predicted nucleic acid-binding protein
MDSSALMKLVVDETESLHLRGHLSDGHTYTSCELAHVEVLRNVARSAPAAVPRARALMARMALIAINQEILAVASDLAPRELRSLDAIHVASAMSLGDELTEIVTYDRRMQAAATAVGVAWAAPGQSLAETDAPPA